MSEGSNDATAPCEEFAHPLSLRREMLQVARLAPHLLGESTALVREFVLRHHNADGGFRGRTSQSDLYYTVFGLDCLLALQVPISIDAVASYLRSFGGGASLDFVHLCCLARCYAALSDAGMRADCEFPKEILSRVEAHRSGDGGYHPAPQQANGTAYAVFLALGAYEDLQWAIPEPERLANSLRVLETPDGAWSNDVHAKAAATNATAAVIAVLRDLGSPIRSSAIEWLMAQAHPLGGFRASAPTPIPDLLSTATALHALAGNQADLGPIRERCIDFIDTLWSNDGSFHGHWHEDRLDVEYTYYGLLALGHLR